MSRRVVLAVHGGAGSLAAHRVRYPGRKVYDRGLARALREGQSILLKGGNAVRAVAAAVAALEDDPLFNAGRGAVLCADGSAELCASVMNGRTLQVGAMAGLKRTRNPVLGAKALLDHAHGFLYGDHGDAFAAGAGLETVSPDYFLTPFRIGQWRRVRGTKKVALDHSDGMSHGTVGAVAMDRRGHLAAATSTGGLVNQLPGRVGDSPIVGAGTWADRHCAVSATGKGDAFVRVAFARRVADLVELLGVPPEEAAGRALSEVAHVRGRGGCIVVDAAGRVGAPFNTRQMLRGWISGHDNPVVAILPGEHVDVG